MTGMANDREKEAAARASLKFVRDGDIVGFGNGSTAAYAVRFWVSGCQLRLEDSRYTDLDSYPGTRGNLGIPLTTLDEFQEIDVPADRRCG